MVTVPLVSLIGGGLACFGFGVSITAFAAARSFRKH